MTTIWFQYLRFGILKFSIKVSSMLFHIVDVPVLCELHPLLYICVMVSARISWQKTANARIIFYIYHLDLEGQPRSWYYRRRQAVKNILILSINYEYWFNKSIYQSIFLNIFFLNHKPWYGSFRNSRFAS